MNIKRPYIEFKTSELIIFVEKEISTLKKYEIEHLINEILFRKKAKDKLKNCLDTLKKKLSATENNTISSTKVTKISSEPISLETFYYQKLSECRATSLQEGNTTISSEFSKIQLNSKLKDKNNINFIFPDDNNKIPLNSLNAIGFSDATKELILVYNSFSEKDFDSSSYLKNIDLKQIILNAELFITDSVTKNLFDITRANSQLFKAISRIKDEFNSYKLLRIYVTSNKKISPKYKAVDVNKIYKIETSLEIIDINSFYLCDIQIEETISSVNKVKKNNKEKIPKRNPKWTRNEIIIALDFYFKHYPHIPERNTPEIKQISEILRNLELENSKSISANYRNVSGVYMKLMNFHSINPNKQAKGLSGGSVLDREIFFEFQNNHKDLSKLSYELTSGVKGSVQSIPKIKKNPSKAISRKTFKQISHTKSSNKRNPKWTRNEIIITLDLYFKNRHNLPKINSSEIKKTSDLLRNLKLKKVKNINSNYRNMASVYMKLKNFQYLDPNHTFEGLSRGSILDQEVFKEFQHNQRDLTFQANKIKTKLKNLDFVDEKNSPLKTNIFKRLINFLKL